MLEWQSEHSRTELEERRNWMWEDRKKEWNRKEERREGKRVRGREVAGSPYVTEYSLKKDTSQRGNSLTQRCTVWLATLGLDFSPYLLPWLGHFIQWTTYITVQSSPGKEGKTNSDKEWGKRLFSFVEVQMNSYRAIHKTEFCHLFSPFHTCIWNCVLIKNILA